MGDVSAKVLLAAVFALIMLCVFFFSSTDDPISEQAASHNSKVVDPGQPIPRSEPEHYQTPPDKSDNNGSPISPGSINVVGGRISVNLEAHSLLAALSEISHRSGVAITADIPDRQVAVQVGDIPLEQGVRLLAQGLDIFFFHDGATGVLKSVWIYEQGAGTHIAPVPAELLMAEADRDIHRRLADADPEERARATEMLIDRGGTQALNWALQAVRDPVDVVRYRMLKKTADVGLSLPQEVLREILSHDPSPLARYIALDIISANTANLDQSAVRQLVEMALSDTDLPVSIHARRVLLAMQPTSEGDIE